MKQRYPFYRSGRFGFISYAAWALLWLWLAAPTAVTGQLLGRYDEDINLSPFPYHIMTYGTQHGLPVNQVEGLARDPHTGALVLATSNGLHQFNGYSFSRYRTHPSYTTTIFVKLFRSHLFEHLLGYNGIGELYHLAEEPESIGQYSAVDITEDYYLTIDAGGSIRYIPSADTIGQTFDSGITDARFVHRLRPDTLLISDASATFLYLTKNVGLTKILDEAIIDIEPSFVQGSHFFLTTSHLYEFISGDINRVELGVSPGQILKSIDALDDVLLISSSTGLIYKFGTYQTQFTENDNLPTNAITTLFRDDLTGTLFMGTGNKGLMKLTPKRVINLFTKSKEFLGSYGSMVFDSGSLFTIAGRNIIKILNAEQYKILDTDYKAESSASLSIVGDTLFAGTWGNGLFAISKSSGKLYYHQNLDDKVVFATYRDPEGVYWVGTFDGVYSGSGVSQLTAFKPDSIQTRVTTVYRTRSGELWFGGGSDIFMLDANGSVRHRYGPEQGFQVTDVRAFHEDDEGKVWIGTYGGGLYCFYDGQLVALRNKPNYMLGEDVFTLVKDQNGNMLMSSNNGLHVLHEDAMDAFVKGRTDYLVPYHIGVQSGVFNTEFNGGFYNNHINIGGNIIYFPTAQGIVFYLARPLEPKRTSLVVNGVYVDGVLVEDPQAISRSAKRIGFEFYDIVFGEFDNVYYQYALGKAGEELAWGEPIRETGVQFDYLPPGSYVFQVRTINGSNAPDPETYTYAFTILPYFYERASFQVGVALLLMVGTFFTVQRRFRRKQARERRELEVANTITELELNAIHAQMNPHLIFNSLNVLVHLIRSKSLERAENFTVDFAQMLRNILERSGEEFTEVGQEIKLICNYLEVQKIRFEDAVSYEIVCEPELLHVRIPTMLVQPLVENAIVHGLSHVLEGGRVALRFERVGDFLRITVEDDGIGRERSAEIQRGVKRRSVGLALMRKKMELMKTKHGIEISFTIEDARTGTRPGTKAVLTMKSLPSL